MPPTIARAAGAVALAASLLVTTACSTGEPPEAPPAASASAEPDATDSAAPTAEPTTAPVADPTCENMIGEDIVADFTDVGWTSLAQPFQIGDVELESGLQCVWADFEGPAGDHLIIFGWAPIDADRARDVQNALVADGWVREDEAAGVYITENPDTTISTDDEGYGLTYLFGDGWVKLADTKQGLVLIDWPPT
ncbi:hypothetical protein GCM10022200_07490 [Microbacterium awajiense]|uniref:Nitrate ABC transporter substrate-binding protein n=1 Tax=Microbacterium awajiense TaxID=415214 RepID=A0ABP7A9P3_9MICO